MESQSFSSERLWAPPPPPPPPTYSYGAGVAASTDTETGGSSGSPPMEPDQLVPVRAYLKRADIPPKGIGAYGVVSLQALPTPDERNRLLMLCNAYKAYLPPQASVSASVAVGDQMLTVWPVDNPMFPQAQADSCDYALDHYDQYAGYLAIRDARRQGHNMTGRGPFLIGWSPSNTRGVPNKLVLVIDMSHYNSQSSFNHALQFWKTEVVENPKLWRKGFHPDMLRYALADFLDQYGNDLLSVVKLTK